MNQHLQSLFADLPQRADRLAHALAPIDLAGVPVYAVPASRLYGPETPPSTCYGFTHQNLDLLLRDLIGDAWRGRGFGLVIDDGAIGADFPEPDDGEFVTSQVDGTILHELAHGLALDFAARFTEPVSPAGIAFQRLCLTAAPPRPVTSGAELIRADFLSHDDNFLRVLLHLQRRFEVITGRRLHDTWCFPRRWTHHALAIYREALGGEPQRMCDASIASVLATPAPAAFTDLWLLDQSDFLITIHEKRGTNQ